MLASACPGRHSWTHGVWISEGPSGRTCGYVGVEMQQVGGCAMLRRCIAAPHHYHAQLAPPPTFKLSRRRTALRMGYAQAD